MKTKAFLENCSPIRKRETEQAKSKQNQRDTSLIKGDSVIPHRIQLYRIWWLYLKLCLEMEENKIGFMIFARSRENKLLARQKRVRVKRNLYSGWDLDEISTMKDYQFDDWWRNHKFLFEEINSKWVSSISEKNPSHLKYLQIDLRKSVQLNINEIRNLLNNEKKKTRNYKSKSFPILGRPREEQLILRRNVFIRFLQGEDNLTIYENEKLRFAEHYELNMKYNDLKSVYGNVRETFNMDLTKEIKRLVRDCQEVMNGICSGKFLYKQKLT